MSPASLYPVREQSKESKIINFLNRHAGICLILCLFVLMVLITVLLYVLIGGSATDSGVYFNHLKGVI